MPKPPEITFDDLKIAIDECGGDIADIAELLNISVHRVTKLMRELELKDYWMEMDQDSDKIIMNYAKSVSLNVLKKMSQSVKRKLPLTKEETKILTTLIGKMDFTAKVEDDGDEEQVTLFEIPDDGRNPHLVNNENKKD